MQAAVLDRALLGATQQGRTRTWPVTPNLTDKERPLFDTFGNAIKAYDMMRMQDPRGPLADDSIMATANAYFPRGATKTPPTTTTCSARSTPTASTSSRRTCLGLQSKLRVYQGELYDGVAAGRGRRDRRADAPSSARSWATSSPRAQTRDAILDQKARRDWAIAQYYDNKKEYGAARIYYQYIIDDYPLTPTAHQARRGSTRSATSPTGHRTDSSG